MPDIRKVRRRIRGVRNIAKITRAMEMIAASKMKKAQERGLAGRPYAEKIEQVIADLAALPDIGLQHPLLQRRDVVRIAVVHITPDRGLCGGLNANLNRRLTAFMLEQKVPVEVVAVGRKGREFAARNSCQLCAEFTQLGDRQGVRKLCAFYFHAGAEAGFETAAAGGAGGNTGRPECGLYLRTGGGGGFGRAAAPLRGDGNLPRHPGVNRQRAIGADGGDAQRYR
jgi:hypothetical protein